MIGNNFRIAKWLAGWGPVVLWMAVIFWVSSLTDRPETPGLGAVSWDDKFQHTTAYAVLTFLVWRALGDARPIWFRAAAAIVFAAAYGALDECHQWFVPGRECSLADWHCDSAGAAAAGVVLGILSNAAGAAKSAHGRATVQDAEDILDGGDGIGNRTGRGEDLRGQGQTPCQS
ncbi:MAG: VanZ family protein [Armatimonadota bacterium]|nr:VanZ family protein [Armatimonadota bacterium]